MSLIDLDVSQMAFGFSIGVASYLIHWLLRSRPHSAKHTEEEAGQAVRERPEPSPEPLPEPLPTSDGRKDTRSRRILAGLAALLVLAVAVAINLWLQTPVEPDSGAAKTQQPAETSSNSSVIAEKPVQTSPDPPAVVGEPSTSAFFTLNLTRQQIFIPQEDGIYYKTAYWGTVHVGEPAVPFSVVFDTGSGHLILPSTYCHSNTCRAHTRYRRSHSSTAKDIDYDGTLVTPGALRDHITVSFGTGEVTGVFVEDVVCMGDAFEWHQLNNTEAIAQQGAIVAHQRGGLPQSCMGLRMIAATEMSEDPFLDFQFDGVLGLGLEGLSQSPEFNIMHLIAREATGTNPHMFAVFLAVHDSEGSEITFGGFDDGHFEEELAWHPVHEPSLGQWMVRVRSIRVGSDAPLAICEDGGCRAIVDTGTSLISVPTSTFPELFELLTHPADFDRCKGGGPKLHIELEAITLTLEPQDYSLFEPATASRVRALITQNEEDAEEDRCKAMLMAMDLPAPLGPKLFVLGEPVLRRYYSVYDASGHPRIGFARARHDGFDA
mmetsp:Transcript_33689/g.78334  ORF Transcript_33689/g.78334 Transcript_33689/m.78334 type:complete len:547 (+) Transcript_33689:118-1758(+)